MKQRNNEQSQSYVQINNKTLGGRKKSKKKKDKVVIPPEVVFNQIHIPKMKKNKDSAARTIVIHQKKALGGRTNLFKGEAIAAIDSQPENYHTGLDIKYDSTTASKFKSQEVKEKRAKSRKTNEKQGANSQSLEPARDKVIQKQEIELLMLRQQIEQLTSSQDLQDDRNQNLVEVLTSMEGQLFKMMTEPKSPNKRMMLRQSVSSLDENNAASPVQKQTGKRQGTSKKPYQLKVEIAIQSLKVKDRMYGSLGREKYQPERPQNSTITKRRRLPSRGPSIGKSKLSYQDQSISSTEREQKIPSQKQWPIQQESSSTQQLLQKANQVYLQPHQTSQKMQRSSSSHNKINAPFAQLSSAEKEHSSIEASEEQDLPSERTNLTTACFQMPAPNLFSLKNLSPMRVLSSSKSNIFSQSRPVEAHQQLQHEEARKSAYVPLESRIESSILAPQKGLGTSMPSLDHISVNMTESWGQRGSLNAREVGIKERQKALNGLHFQKLLQSVEQTSVKMSPMAAHNESNKQSRYMLPFGAQSGSYESSSALRYMGKQMDVYVGAASINASSSQSIHRHLRASADNHNDSRSKSINSKNANENDNYYNFVAPPSSKKQRDVSTAFNQNDNESLLRESSELVFPSIERKNEHRSSRESIRIKNNSSAMLAKEASNEKDILTLLDKAIKTNSSFAHHVLAASPEASSFQPYLGEQRQNHHASLGTNSSFKKAQTIEQKVGGLSALQTSIMISQQEQQPRRQIIGGSNSKIQTKLIGTSQRDLLLSNTKVAKLRTNMIQNAKTAFQSQKSLLLSDMEGQSRNSEIALADQILSKCNIRLSDTDGAELRVAGPGNLPFNSLSTVSLKKAKGSARANNLVSSEEKKRTRKLAEMTDNLPEVIEELRKRQPWLTQLSQDQVEALLLDDAATGPDTSAERSERRSQQSQKREEKKSKKHIPQVLLARLLQRQPQTQPLCIGQIQPQIVNHFNITINHSGAQAADPTTQSDNQKQKISYSDLQSILMAKDSALHHRNDNDHQVDEYQPRPDTFAAQIQDYHVEPQISQFNEQQAAAAGRGAVQLKQSKLVRPASKTDPNFNARTYDERNSAAKPILSAANNELQKQSNPGTTLSQGLQTLNQQASSKDMRRYQAYSVAHVNPVLDFFGSLIHPNVVQIEGANKICQALRYKMEDDDKCRMYEKLDVLIVGFEGVLGAFVPISAQDREKNYTNSLCLRPGLAAAFHELIKNFKIAIVVKEQSPHRQRLIKKALKIVPFDGFYRVLGDVTNDNYFTYQSIKRDLNCIKQQALFITSTNFSLSTPTAENLGQKMKQVDVQREFSLMPISTGMESLVIMSVENLLVEAKFFDEDDRVTSEIDLCSTQVCDMTSVSKAIIDFFNVAFAYRQKDNVAKEFPQTEIKDRSRMIPKPKQRQLSNFSNSKTRTPMDSAHATNSRRPTIDRNRLATSKKFTNFQLLCSLTEAGDNLYPMHLFQANVEKERNLNTFVHAFEKGQTYHFKTMNYFTPEGFSIKILGHRLREASLRLGLKLRKIKQAIKNVARKEAVDAEKTFRDKQGSYEIVRKQPAFQTFQKFNSNYFAEIYDECSVRLPCHPSKEQFEKLQSIYRQLQSRIDNLVKNTFPFSKSDAPYYNLMMLEANFSRQNRNPIEVFESKTRRQFVIKDAYLLQNKALMIEIQRHNNLKKIASQSEPQTTRKVEIDSVTLVPDLLLWMAAQAAPLTAMNTIPKKVLTDEVVKKV